VPSEWTQGDFGGIGAAPLHRQSGMVEGPDRNLEIRVSLRPRNDGGLKNSIAIFDSIRGSATRLRDRANREAPPVLLGDQLLGERQHRPARSVSQTECGTRRSLRRTHRAKGRGYEPVEHRNEIRRRMPRGWNLGRVAEPGGIIVGAGAAPECAPGVSCSGATAAQKTSNTLSWARLSE